MKNILYIPHGGEPLPLLGDKLHSEMVSNLQELSEDIKIPSAIILISAHWEEDIPTITSDPNPELIYDYYGFPEEAYSIKYPCSGEPELAKKVHSILTKSNLESRLDGNRGFDHGLFVPLKIMYPEADIPCIQLSLVKGLNSSAHLKLGSALSKINYDNLLIIGSGFSFHNMKAFFEPDTSDSRAMNERFEKWLIDTCSSKKIDENERNSRLQNWENAPHARYCHPREEHLMPLHVCYGAAQSACTEYIELNILGKKSNFFLWEDK